MEQIVVQMTKFAFEIVKKLDAINKHCFNDFKLRIGWWACIRAGNCVCSVLCVHV